MLGCEVAKQRRDERDLWKVAAVTCSWWIRRFGKIGNEGSGSEWAWV